MRRIRRHLTFANVASAIALFVALSGGTAVALSGTDTVQSDDLGPGSQVTAPDVAANAVNGTDVVDGSLTGADIAPSALSRGRAITSACNPNTTTFADCGAVTINLTRTARVLIVTSAQWLSLGGASQGTCRIGVDGAPSGPNAFPGEIADTTGLSAENSLTLTNVTGPLAPGPHTFGLACNDRGVDIVYNETYVSVVVLGPG